MQGLTKLKDLYISNTDINSSWEHLPNSIKEIYYSHKERPNSKVKEISEQLTWIGKDFSGQQIKEWIEIGLTLADYNFANYLKRKGYNPQSELDLEELRKEYRKAQDWLDQNYPDKQTYSICLNQQLTGVLDCQEYKDLRRIFISTSVDSSKLELKGGSYKYHRREETKIIPCQSAQTYLNQNYPPNGTCQIILSKHRSICYVKYSSPMVNLRQV